MIMISLQFFQVGVRPPEAIDGFLVCLILTLVGCLLNVNHPGTQSRVKEAQGLNVGQLWALCRGSYASSNCEQILQQKKTI